MSAVSKSLILGTLAGALALGGCGGDGGGGGSGAGAAAMGGAGATTGGAGGVGGVNPTAGAGAMGGNAGTNPMMSGMSGMTGGVGVSGMTGGASGVSGAGTGGEPMCPFEVMCASTNDIRSDMPCENAASGVFAIKTVIDVWWKDDIEPPLVDPGRGFITVYLKGTLTDVCSDGSSGCGEMMGCGVVLPPFASWVNCNAYNITFPDELWEKPGMPKFYTTGSVDKFEPGGLLTIAKATGLVGFDMNDADTAMWPTSVNMVSCAASETSMNPIDCFPDHDGDGLPGVSIKMGGIGTNYRDTGCGAFGDAPVKFQGAPLDAIGTGLCDPSADPSCKRAVDLQIGVRTRLGGGGLIDECDASGAASGKGDSDADYVDSRVAGCKLNDGTDCDVMGVEFVDSAAPNYNILDKGTKPPADVMMSACECPGGCLGGACPLPQTDSLGARSAVVRLGDAGMNFDCAAVRSMVDAKFPGTDF